MEAALEVLSKEHAHQRICISTISRPGCRFYKLDHRRGENAQYAVEPGRVTPCKTRQHFRIPVSGGGFETCLEKQFCTILKDHLIGCSDYHSFLLSSRSEKLRRHFFLKFTPKSQVVFSLASMSSNEQVEETMKNPEFQKTMKEMMDSPVMKAQLEEVSRHGASKERKRHSVIFFRMHCRRGSSNPVFSWSKVGI